MLKRIIQERIAPGSIIYGSNLWKGYIPLKELDYVHQTLITLLILLTESGVHTQNVERLWRDIHSALLRFGIREGHYEHYLAEFMFKK